MGMSVSKGILSRFFSVAAQIRRRETEPDKRRRRGGVLRWLGGLIVLAIAGATVGVATSLGARSADAAAYQITGTGNGVAFRWSPHTSDLKQPVHGAYDGNTVEILCQSWGDAVGPYNNQVWDFISFNGERAWINDHWTNTPVSANQFTPGIAQCIPGTSDIVGGQIIGVATNDPHAWGACTAQDFNQNIPGTPYGWYIRAGHGNVNQLVRNGMLWGWFDNGGAAGTLGCPSNWEYGYNGGSRQDFDGGFLLWCPGWDHAKRWVAPMVNGCGNPAPAANQHVESAIAWASAKMSLNPKTTDANVWPDGPNGAANNQYNQWCLQFVYDAFRQAGTPLDAVTGANNNPVRWWNSHGTHHADQNPPRGAWVFWGKTKYNGLGHVAISLGNGQILSTGERTATVVHTFAISDRNGLNYLGWWMPPV
jgi:hypothetical protein